MIKPHPDQIALVFPPNVTKNGECQRSRRPLGGPQNRSEGLTFCAQQAKRPWRRKTPPNPLRHPPSLSGRSPTARLRG